MSHHAFRIRLAALILSLVVGPVSAATWIWPDLVFSGPCSGTLQACINNAGNGDSILIGGDSIVSPDRYTGITGDLFIGKALHLSAMPGIDAVFEGGTIVIHTPAALVGDVTLSGLVVRNGRVEAREYGSSSATITLERLLISNPLLGYCAINLATTLDTIAAQTHFIVRDNRIVFPGVQPHIAGTNGICVYGHADGFRADISGNDIRSPMRGIVGMIIGGGTTAPGNVVHVSRNRVHLDGNSIGLWIQNNNPGASNAMTISNNIVTGAAGNLNEAAGAILVSDYAAEVNLVNNSLIRGGTGIYFNALGNPDLLIARAANNLIAHQTTAALRCNGAVLANDHNVLHDVTTNVVGSCGALGPGTLSSDPQIESDAYPRPTVSSSPLVDAGDDSALPAFTLFDADGEKRQQGPVDIGAIEFSYDGTRIHDTTASNSFGNESALDLDDYPFPLFTTDRLVVTPLRVAAGISAGSANLGVYQSNTFARRWAIFNQDLSTLPAGRRFAVLLPWDSRTAVLHTVAAGNIPGSATAETEIDHASLNNQAAAIAVVTPNWNPANTPSGTYHDHPITLVYRGNRWRIRNDDAASMNSAVGASFNLAVAPLFSPNAFMAELGSSGANEIALSHPLLDDNPCAAPVASRRVKIGDGSLTLNSTPFALEYREPINANDVGRWYIVKEDALGFSPHNAFNVIVDGAQANRCRAPKPDALFANGFE